MRSPEPELTAELTDRGAEVGGCGGDTVAERRRLAEAGQVDRDHVALGGKALDHRIPDPPRPPEAVDQDERVAGSSA